MNFPTVNNAGIVAVDSDLYDESSESLDIAQEIMNVNLWGSARVMQAVLPSMKSHQSGHLVNITSGAGVQGKDEMTVDLHLAMF